MKKPNVKGIYFDSKISWFKKQSPYLEMTPETKHINVNSKKNITKVLNSLLFFLLLLEFPIYYAKDKLSADLWKVTLIS